MSDQPLSRVTPPSPPSVARLSLVAASAIVVFSAGVGTGALLRRPRALPPPPLPPAPAVDPCALPQGIELSALGATDRGWIARRAVLCADQLHGRLSLADYRARIDELDRPPRPIAPPAPSILWGASIREFSSQYTTSSWAATRVLGPPDVAVLGGDDANAWASAGEDDRIEFLEVGFDRALPAAGVEIVESYNPGAITRIELIGIDGERTSVYDADARPLEQPFLRRVVDFTCSAQPIVAVRLTIDSRNVSGWNEIDAIGLRPCQ